MIRKLFHLLGGIGILVMIAPPLSATIVPKMDLPQLVQNADAIVQGTVEQVYSRWDAEHKLVFTYVPIRVDESIKGGPRRTVLIRQLGGTIGALNMMVAGTPSFQAGDQAIMFLSDQNDGTFQVVGLSQGRYAIVDNNAVADTAGLSLLDPKTRLVSDAAVTGRIFQDAGAIALAPKFIDDFFHLRIALRKIGEAR